MALPQQLLIGLSAERVTRVGFERLHRVFSFWSEAIWNRSPHHA